MDIYTQAQNGTLTRSILEGFLRSCHIDHENAKTGLTLLSTAIKGGHAGAVRLLLQRKANANKCNRDGRTPLYLVASAHKNRGHMAHLLLEHGANVNETNADWGNETPLMVAITQARDPDLIRVLIDAGASLTKRNDKGESSQFLLDQSSNPAIKNAIVPKGQETRGRMELVSLVVNFVLFILAYVNSGLITGVIKGIVSSLYGILDSQQPDSTITKEIDNPKTIKDFIANINGYVLKNGLDDFFPPGDRFLEKVAEKAVKLSNDTTNILNTSSQIRDLTTAALYQPILYCDDSGSMEGNRMLSQSDLVQRITSIATRAVPDGRGAHLRFINKSSEGFNNLTRDEIQRKMTFNPHGGTMIGTRLREKVLKPFVHDVLDNGGSLERPYLILTITDGCPEDEDTNTFRNAIVECGKKLVDKGYRPQAVMFFVGQVGTSPESENFLNSLEEDSAVSRVLFRTAEHLDEKYEELRMNEKDLEIWLLRLLLSPINNRL